MIVMNLRGLATTLFVGVPLLYAADYASDIGLVSDGWSVGWCFILTSFLCSLFAFSTDRCDSERFVRSYWDNLQQFGFETFGQTPPEHFSWNPSRRLAMFVCPLAFYPHVLVTALACCAAIALFRDNPPAIAKAALKGLPPAMGAAAIATMYGLATTRIRMVSHSSAERPHQSGFFTTST